MRKVKGKNEFDVLSETMTVRRSLIFRITGVIFAWLPLSVAALGISETVFAANEIVIREVQAVSLDSGEYSLQAQIKNQTDEKRDVILRAQISFYDRVSPAAPYIHHIFDGHRSDIFLLRDKTQ